MSIVTSDLNQFQSQLDAHEAPDAIKYGLLKKGLEMLSAGVSLETAWNYALSLVKQGHFDKNNKEYNQADLLDFGTFLLSDQRKGILKAHNLSDELAGSAMFADIKAWKGEELPTGTPLNQLKEENPNEEEVAPPAPPVEPEGPKPTVSDKVESVVGLSELPTQGQVVADSQQAVPGELVKEETEAPIPVSERGDAVVKGEGGVIKPEHPKQGPKPKAEPKPKAAKKK